MKPADWGSSDRSNDPLIIPADAALPDAADPSSSDDDLSMLRAVMEGTSHRTGNDFLRSLVQHLVVVMDVQYAMVTELLDDRRVRSLVFWAKDRIAPNIEWSLPGTPCEAVIGGNLCHYPSGVFQRFPNDQILVELGIESFTGAPLRDSNGNTLGHIVVFDQRPRSVQAKRLYAFRIFADRATMELQRMCSEKAPRKSEQPGRGPQ